MYLLFKSTVCGDLLSSSSSAIKNALVKLSKSKNLTQEESIEMLGVVLHVPDPVFFCSIEPPSQVYHIICFFILIVNILNIST